MRIRTDSVLPNPEQPRVFFDDSSLQELAQSIKEVGLISPIIVEDIGERNYMLVDGERRLRAHKLLGLDEIKAEIQETKLDAKQRLMLALTANLQRADMNPIEEARAYKRLQDEFGLSQKTIGKKVGKSQGLISVRMNLLYLDPEIQELYAEGKLPIGQTLTTAFMSITDRDKRVALARQAAARGMVTRTILGLCTRIRNIEDGEDWQGRRKGIKRSKQQASGDGELYPVELAGGVIEEPGIKNAARKACKKCPLFDMSSLSVCKDCPLVDFVKEYANAN